jgi:hypothetical protein
MLLAMVVPEEFMDVDPHLDGNYLAKRLCRWSTTASRCNDSLHASASVSDRR